MGLFDGADMSNWGTSNFKMPGQQPQRPNTDQGMSGGRAGIDQPQLYNTSQGSNNNPWGGQPAQKYDPGFQLPGTENPGEIPLPDYQEFLGAINQHDPNTQYKQPYLGSALQSGFITSTGNNMYDLTDKGKTLYSNAQNGAAGSGPYASFYAPGGPLASNRSSGNVIANTSQGMNGGGFGNFGGDLSRLAGNGGGVSQVGQDRLQHLQSTMGGLSPNLPPPGTVGQQPLPGANPQAGRVADQWFDDPNQQMAMVQKLGNTAPSFVANPQSQQDWQDRYFYLAHNGQNAGTSYNQAGENIGLRPSTALANGERDYAHPDQIGYDQFQKNVYGGAGANRQFNELSGQIGADSAALHNGWQLATPQGTPDQGKALALAYTLGQKNPGVDYSVVQTADGFNIAARPQDYHPNLPQPGMAGGGGAPRYSGGGGSNYRNNGSGNQQSNRPWYETTAPPPRNAPAIEQLPNSPEWRPGMPGGPTNQLPAPNVIPTAQNMASILAGLFPTRPGNGSKTYRE